MTNAPTCRKVLVSGGAGFIGSHLVDALLARGLNVCVFDNFSNGTDNNLKQNHLNCNLKVVHDDLLKKNSITDNIGDCDAIFHLAANPEVWVSSISPETHYRQNVEATFNLLEALRKAGNVETFFFTSSSTVCGEAKVIPTPEDYAPLEPISVYGASKLACEALVTAYAHTYGFKAVVYRLANIVGPRNQHGVINDFIRKLRKDPENLEILGDGTQTKSYLHVTDCIEALLLGFEKTRNRVEVFNVGSEDQVNVKTIAQIVAEEMGLHNVKFSFTGGVDGGRGWMGDVKNMLLDVNKLKSLGWGPKMNSQEAVRQAVRDIITEK